MYYLISSLLLNLLDKYEIFLFFYFSLPVRKLIVFRQSKTLDGQ